MTASSLTGESGGRTDGPPGTKSRSEGQLPRVNHYAATESLYRKYRPRSFDQEELVGQEHVVRTLQNAIALGRVAHAYLFSGPRGTGKTTTARLLAKAVNCSHEDPKQRPCNACANCASINMGATPDVIEIDAASNRGIDDIRDLRDRVRYAPAQLPSKIYIIDEAHQITGAAANAFLKTLEEPPVHTRFILATTDPEELLPTIVSRCQRFEFRRVNSDAITRRLKTVAQLEDISATDEALRLIARHATGSLRDALGLLEQLTLLVSRAHGPAAAGTATIDESAVQAALGLSRNDRVEGLVAAISQHDAGAALSIVQSAIDDGDDPRQLNQQLVAYVRLLLLERSGAPAATDDRAKALAATFSLLHLADLARRFGEIDFNIKHSPFPQLPLEVALVEATATPQISSESSPPVALRPASRPDEPLRPTSLRDRVRGTNSVAEETRSGTSSQHRTEPSPVTQIRPLSTAPAAASTDKHHAIDVESIADLWPRVRGDVKALNRRVEALLSEVDPVAIAGNQITLAVPYPFHRDKLNSDEVRELLASVLSRLLGQDISISCILRADLGAQRDPSQDEGREPSSVTQSAAENDQLDGASDAEERARERRRAAINIFDAVELEEPLSIGLQTPSDPI